MTKLRVLLIGCFLAFFTNDIWATHIRAGEITAVRISQSSLRYRFTLVLYKDTGSNVEVGEGVSSILAKAESLGQAEMFWRQNRLMVVLSKQTLATKLSFPSFNSIILLMGLVFM